MNLGTAKAGACSFTFDVVTHEESPRSWNLGVWYFAALPQPCPILSCLICSAAPSPKPQRLSLFVSIAMTGYQATGEEPSQSVQIKSPGYQSSDLVRQKLPSQKLGELGLGCGSRMSEQGICASSSLRPRWDEMIGAAGQLYPSQQIQLGTSPVELALCTPTTEP